MKTLLPLILALGGCMHLAPETGQYDPTHTASSYIGTHESRDRELLQRFVIVNPESTEWCAAFVNATLRRDGKVGSWEVSDHPLLARSFLTWGERVDLENIQRGDIVVFNRGSEGWQGHVGFYIGSAWVDGKQRLGILGGNQEDSVKYSFYDPDRVIGIRRYRESNEVETGQ